MHGSPLREMSEETIGELSLKLDDAVRFCFEKVLNDHELSEAVTSKEDILDAYMLKTLLSWRQSVPPHRKARAAQIAIILFLLFTA